MADEKIVISTVIDYGDTEQQTEAVGKSINDLKEDIKEYQTQVNEATVGSEEWTEAVNNLTQAQDELNQANEEIKNSLKEINAARQELTKSDQDGEKSVKTLRTEVKNYQNDLLNLERGSKEYNDTLKQLAQTQGQLNAINQDIRASTTNLTALYGELASVGAGVAAGFNAVKAAGAMLGVENEALAQTFVQLQAGMALVQSLQALSKGIKSANIAFKAFNATLYANPIIEVVAVVAALVAGLAILANWWSSSKSGVDELKASYEDFIDSIQDLQKEQDFEIKKLQAMGATEKEIAEARLGYAKERAGLVEDAKKEVDDEIAYLESKWKPWFSGQRKRLKELRRQQAEFAEQVAEIEEEIAVETANIEIAEIKEVTAERTKAAAEAKRLAEKAARDQEQAEIELTKALQTIWGQREAERIALLKPEERLAEIEAEITKQEEAAARFLKLTEDTTLGEIERAAASRELFAAQAQLANLQNEQTLINNNLKEQREAEIAEAEALKLANDALIAQEEMFAFQRERRLLEGREQAEFDLEKREQDQLFYDSEVERLEQELLQEGLDNEKRIELLAELQTARDTAFKNEQSIFTQRKKLREQDLKDEEKDAENKKKIRDLTLAQTANALNAGAQLLGENTAAGKAAAVAAATISTYQAGSNVLSTVPYPANIPAMVSVIATGLANVKSILSTKVDGAGGNSVSSTTALTPSYPSMPELAEPIQETHNNYDAYDEAMLNQSKTVLVVEDYNEVANRVEVAETNSTF